MPSVERLKERLQQTLKAKKFDAALGALTLLAREQPNDATWPRRTGHLLKFRSDPRGALAAHRRALDLQVEQGVVLDAIASCKAILELEPEDPPTLEILGLLYVEESPSNAPPLRPAQPKPKRSTPKVRPQRDEGDSALDALVLHELVPGARAVTRGEGKPGRVNEIPIDGATLRDGISAIDLRLEDSAVESDPSGVLPPSVARKPKNKPKNRAGKKLRESSPRGATLRSQLAEIPLFGELDPSSLHRLIEEVRVEKLSPGQVLFRQGDPSKSLYVVVEGAVVPIAEGKRRRKLAVLERGDFFGEIGLLTKQPRNATIEALVTTKLLAIDRGVVRELIEAEPNVAGTILRFLRARLIDRQIRTHLFFSAFVHAERAEVARQFRFLEVDAGTVLVEEGQAPDGLYVVLSGSLSLEKKRKEIGEAAAGGVFGGLSLVDGGPAPTSVVAREKCWLIVLGEGRFRRIMEANPRLERVLRRLAGEASEARSGLIPVGL